MRTHMAPANILNRQVGWTFTKRVALSGPEALESMLIQVVVLDDLIEEDDKRCAYAACAAPEISQVLVLRDRCQLSAC